MNTKSKSHTEFTCEFDLDKDKYIETPWTIIESYFKGQHLERLVRHQLESYNNFVGYQLIKTIEMFNPVCIASDQDYDNNSGKHSLEIFITFENFRIFRPQIHENNGATKLMFPQEARLRNFTYSSSMVININIKYLVRTGENLENTQTFYKTLNDIHIGKLPIMLKSNICVLNQHKHIVNTGECKYDTGGYFIINGSEKTVLGQERAAENKVYCFNVSKNNTKYSWIAEIKSVPDFKCISPKQINLMLSCKNNGFGYSISVQLPRVKQPIPLFIVFRALGIISDKQICDKIILDLTNNKYKELLSCLHASIIESNTYLTQEEAIKYIKNYVMFTPINMDKELGAKKKYEFTMDILNNDLFPHCNTPVQKIYFLGYMANRLLQASLEWIKPDDRDSYLNKRVDLTGTLLNNLFRNYFNKVVKDMEKQIIKEINTGSWKSTDNYINIINPTNIYKIIKSTTIENGIKRALSTGDFGMKHINSTKIGVAQVLNRLTYVSSLSHARRISTPVDKSGKLIPPRKLHNTTWGFICLTGDTDVLLSNRIDTKKIIDITDGNWVNTVNRQTLLDEPSDIYNSFCKMPDKLFEIVTISGRKIKATMDHPLLIKISDQKYEMKKVSQLKIHDKVIIRHTVLPIPDQNTTVVVINDSIVFDHYRLDLLEKNLLNIKIPLQKLKIIARLIGALNTHGHLGTTFYEKINKNYYQASFNVGEEYDVYQLADDVKTLGFENVSIRRNISKFEDKKTGTLTTSTTWEVTKNGSFAYFMYLMGAFLGKKTDMKRTLPEWLINAELSIKREYLSAFQGGDGSRLLYNKKCFPTLKYTLQTTYNDYLNDTINYMNQIITMFSQFNIQCHLITKNINDFKSIVSIVFDNHLDNLIKYADTINYTYCEEKRRKSAVIIEHLKIKKYIKDYKYTNSLIYENFIKENIVHNGCVSIPILSITEIEPEFVYDFTTRSDNHSFVASSFVSSNCLAETPEGQSVGVVKNLSYMTHVTIHSNTIPIYEYINPHITIIENLKSSEMINKVKVFINGAWIGISNEPFELFNLLKERKQKGIINIYTSIVFDYKMGEIRICNDSGRLSRPLLRLKNGNLLINNTIIQKIKNNDLNWDDLLTNCKIDESIIEYIDPEEQSWSLIAMKPKDLIKNPLNNQIMKYTHCEIHPSTIFGVLASCIPFPEHNQSPRNTYQCLDINETVLFSNGSKVPIKDVKIGDEVYCFNPETMETSYTKVVNQYIRETDKQIYKIKTLSGREIIATDDHKFMTLEGWCQVNNMAVIETKIGLMPNQIVPLQNNNSEEICILSEEEFRRFFRSKHFTEKIIDKYVSHLKQQELLPLYNSNYKLPIIARIFGFILADGSINIYERNSNKFTACSFDFGTEEDVKSFENDLQICGFNKCKYNKASRNFNNIVHTTYTVTHSGVLPALLLSLGVSYGRKTETARNSIPSWIMNGNKLVKREFLSGVHGGDGCKIRWNKMSNGYNFVCSETSQQINPKYSDSLISFMSQCVVLFKEFDIEVSNVKTFEIETNRVKSSYKITDKHSNLIQYFDNIGYRYASTKNNTSFVIVEYLRYKQSLFDSHKKNIELIRSLHDENKTNSSIASELNVKVSYIADVIKSYKNNRSISMRYLGKNTIEQWIEETVLFNNMLFIPVDSIELVSNRLISDITVESSNHSFIAGNNFLSSNCAQAKQAMGVYVTNYDNRMDKTAYVLNYPARPLVDTRIMDMIQINKIPSGFNVIVAIMTHTGYNQEDSLLFNKGSIDRGLFQATIYHTEKDEDKQKINGEEEIRCKPDPTKTKGMKFGNYNKVNHKGLIPENTIINNRDVIIAKVTPIKENRNDHTKLIKYEDQSRIYRTDEETYVDKNYIDRNGDGYNFAKVRTRTVRKLVIGDKFCALPTQQVLTDSGWIPICDIDITKHKVCTLDSSGNMHYEYPSAKFEYDHDDKMYSIKNKQVEIVCTLNHKLYVQRRYKKSFELIEAQHVMGKMVRFQKTMKNAYSDVEYIEFNKVKYLMNDWLPFLGMFIADGSTNCRGSIQLSCFKERKIDFNSSLLTKLGLNWKYNDKNGKFTVLESHYPEIYKHLDSLSVGAANKYLPDYVWTLSPNQCIILLEALLQGDGHTYKYKDEDEFSRYGTISLTLANDISRLALHCGWSGNIKIASEPDGIAHSATATMGARKGKTTFITQKHTYYKISIIRKQNQPWINKKKNDSNEENLIDYKGKVYCIEMPTSHIYYMRESNISTPCIVGNSSRAGQKGTLGNIIPEEDMPFTAEGLKPDLILNPHAIPSRMTIAQLKETLLGKVLLQLGLFGDGTSFGEMDMSLIVKELQKVGFESYGNEILYNGLTGEQHECSVFIGPVFYQRLKHMVADKQHSRSIGPMVNLTRQPAEGRSRDGGLRFGEMERDAMISHGASRFTKGRMYDASDKYQVYTCKKCGMIASYNDKVHIHHCRTCDNRTDFSYVEIPYSCKLLFQELMTMNICPRIMTDN